MLYSIVKTVLLLFIGILAFAQDSNEFLSDHQRENDYQRELEGFDSVSSDFRHLQATSLNLNLIKNVWNNETQYMMNSTYPRLEIYVTLNKEIYKPGDMILAEFLLINAFNKTGFSYTTLQERIKLQAILYKFTVEIYQPNGSLLYETSVQMGSLGACFMFKLPINLMQGAHTLKVYNKIIPQIRKRFVIGQYQIDRQIIFKSFKLNAKAYQVGDQVTGNFNIALKNGDQLDSNLLPKFNYTVQFGVSTFSNVLNAAVSTDGSGVLAFSIPTGTTIVNTTIDLRILYQNQNIQLSSNIFTDELLYSIPLIIAQPSLTVVDFYHDINTFSFTRDIPNTIYFEAFTHSTRKHHVTITGAVLKQRSRSGNGVDQVLVSNINSVHLGRGSFNFTPQADYEPLLEFRVFNEATNQFITIQRYLYYNYSSELESDQELVFRVLNNNKVLRYEENLMVSIQTNSKVRANCSYLLWVSLKEQILYQQVLSLSNQSTQFVTVEASKFDVVNGGVLQISINRICTQNSEINNVVDSSSDSSLEQSLSTLITNSIYQVKQDKILAQSTPVSFIPDLSWNTYKKSKNSTAPRKLQVKTATKLTATQQMRVDLYNMVQIGETLFFKKPSSVVDVRIWTEKNSYLVGEQVYFNVSITNRTTGQLISKNCYLSIQISDENVLNQRGEASKPMSAASKIHLQNQVKLNLNYHLPYSQQYLEHLFSTDSEDQSVSSDTNLGLLLSIQSWRRNTFSLMSMKYLFETGYRLSIADRNRVQSLYGYLFYDPMLQMAPLDITTTDENSFNMSTSGLSYGSDQTQNDARLFDFYRSYYHNTIINETEFDATDNLAFMSQQLVKNGFYQGNFKMSELSTKFRITASALEITGILGQQSILVQTLSPLQIDFSAPSLYSLGDKINIKFQVQNDNLFPLTFSIIEVANPILKPNISTTIVYTVDAQSTLQRAIQLTAQTVGENATLKLGVSYILNGQRNTQYKNLTIQVINPQYVNQNAYAGGFINLTQEITPNIFSFLGTGAIVPTNAQNVTLKIPANVNQAGKVTLKAKIFGSLYTMIQSLLEQYENGIKLKNYDFYEGISGIMNQNYDMLGRMQILPATLSQYTTYNSIVQMREDVFYEILRNLEKHSQFASKNEKGFEMFGSDPSDYICTTTNFYQRYQISLADMTALSNLQAQMAKYKAMILSQSSFKDSRKCDSISEQHIQAYLLYMILDSNIKANYYELYLTVQAVADQMHKVKQGDPYFLSLWVLGLKKIRQDNYFIRFLDLISSAQQSSGVVRGASTTVYCSSGIDLDIEVTSLAIMAWMITPTLYDRQIYLAMNWLSQQNQGGRFGSIQSTKFAMMAIQTNLNYWYRSTGTGFYNLKINGQVIQSQRNFTLWENINKIEFNTTNFTIADTKLKTAGTNYLFEFSITNYTGNGYMNIFTQVQYSYEVDINNLVTDTTRNISLNVTALDFNQAVLNSQVSLPFRNFTYQIDVTNKMTTQEVGVTVVVFRIPSCLGVSIYALDQLKSSQIFDEYQYDDNLNTVIFQFRKISRATTKRITIPLRQKYSSLVCNQRTHRAYLFFNSEQKVYAKTNIK